MFANSRCSNVPSHGPFVWETRKAFSARRVSQDYHPNFDAYLRSLASPQSKQKRSASVIVWRNSLMLLPEFARSTTLRWTFLMPGLVTVFIVALHEFIYLKTQGDPTRRSDRMIASQMGVFTDFRSSRGWTRSGYLGRNCRGAECGITRPGFSR
jgi:hypothetical protein